MDIIAANDIIAKLATMEDRIQTEAKINSFDRALIAADLCDISKDEALKKILFLRSVWHTKSSQNTKKDEV